MSLENNFTIETPENTQQENSEKNISKHEFLFRQYVEGRLFDSFSQELKKFEYTNSQMEDFYRYFDNLEDFDRHSLLAFPWELKQRALPMLKKKIEQGIITMEDGLNKILDASKKQSRDIAYHCSSFDIAPKEEKDAQGKNIEAWVIKGTENDHRDNDLPMAYYSFDYYHLYRVKNPRFLYLVSIQKGEGLGHRKDGNNVWGRAPSLTIIDKIDLREADQHIQEQADLYKDEKKQVA